MDTREEEGGRMSKAAVGHGETEERWKRTVARGTKVESVSRAGGDGGTMEANSGPGNTGEGGRELGREEGNGGEGKCSGWKPRGEGERPAGAIAKPAGKTVIPEDEK